MLIQNKLIDPLVLNKIFPIIKTVQ